MSATKDDIRKLLRAQRATLSPAERVERSVRIARNIISHAAFARAKTVALYAAFGDEADPIAVEIAAHALHKRTVYPKIGPEGLTFHPALRTELITDLKARYPIPTPPSAAPAIDIGAIDLFVVPGLAFTKDHARLGYGRGYYDRALTAARKRDGTKTVAIAFAFMLQLVPALPTTPDDQPVDFVATESGIL